MIGREGGTHPDGDETAPDDGWSTFSGTSAAAPQLAGAAALVKQACSRLTPAQVKDVLMKSARDVTAGNCSPFTGANPAGPGPDTATGNGLVDAHKAVLLAKVRCLGPIRGVIRPRTTIEPVRAPEPIRRPPTPIEPVRAPEPIRRPPTPIEPIRPPEPIRRPPVPVEPIRPAKADDLKCIEGIGPKIASLLQASGITTFAQLANTDASRVRRILEESDPRLLRLIDPTTWSEQASLASAEKWEELEALQNELRGGRRA